MIETGSGSPVPTTSDTRSLPCIVPLPYYPYPPYFTHYLGSAATDPLKYLGGTAAAAAAAAATDPLKYLGSSAGLVQDQVRLYLAQEQLKYSSSPSSLKVTQNLLNSGYGGGVTAGLTSDHHHGTPDPAVADTSGTSSRGSSSVFTIESLLAPKTQTSRIPSLHSTLPRTICSG